MLFRLAVPILLMMAGQTIAAPRALSQDLFDALRLGETLAIMREEGIGYGTDLEADMFPGRGGAGWRNVVAGLYDIEAMEQTVLDGMDQRLEAPETEIMIDFFTSDLGATIVTLEIEARRAMQDEEIEEAAEERAARMRADDAPRSAMIDDLVAANDLVDMNVAGALNSNFAFYRGLVADDANGLAMSEDMMLDDVWAQEPEIRADTDEWMHGYLTLAYQPLTDDELAHYIALSATPEGQALNDALFGAFDRLYVDISRRLGESAATFMAGEDI